MTQNIYLADFMCFIINVGTTPKSDVMTHERNGRRCMNDGLSRTIHTSSTSARNPEFQSFRSFGMVSCAIFSNIGIWSGAKNG